MADLMSGPNAPLTRAFVSCGWSCLTVDWLLDDTHDLSNVHRQASLSAQLEDVIFIAAETVAQRAEHGRFQGDLKMGDRPQDP